MDEATADELGQRAALNGVELAFDEWGDPDSTTLVLGHGFSGGAIDFSLAIPALSRRTRVVAFDHRGHGRSTKLGTVAGYSLDQLTADLVGLLERVGGGPVDLLGHSMGGRVALGVALARRDLVRSLILMDTFAGPFDLDPAVAELVRTFFADFDPAAGPTESSLGGPEDALIEAATPARWRQRRDELRRGFDPYAMKALGAELFGGAFASLQPRLGEVSCPVTVIVGSRDHPFVELAPALVSAIPDATLRVIDGAYHSPQLTHAGAWLEAVLAHLDARGGVA
jgi:2-succinyl-6-hydroxy-2,4-cyclohexadiene-1-carboxylate synthase